MNRNKRRKLPGYAEAGLQISQSFRNMLGNKKNLLISMCFPLVALFITVWIAGEDMFVNFESTQSGSFLIVSAAIWGGLFNSVQTVVAERKIIKHDYVSGGMRIRYYMLSRALTQFLLCVIQSAVLTCSYIGIEMIYDNSLPSKGILQSNVLLEYYLSILLLTYAADTMGLFFSCFAKNAEGASAMAPYILIVQLIFSGVLFDLEGIADKASAIMVSRWGMEALGSISKFNSLPSRIAEEIPNYTREADKMFKHSAPHLWKVWLIFLVFIIVFLIAGDIFLHRVSSDTRE